MLRKVRGHSSVLNLMATQKIAGIHWILAEFVILRRQNLLIDKKPHFLWLSSRKMVLRLLI